MFPYRLAVFKVLFRRINTSPGFVYYHILRLKANFHLLLYTVFMGELEETPGSSLPPETPSSPVGKAYHEDTEIIRQLTGQVTEAQRANALTAP
jgi:hypothetical protein